MDSKQGYVILLVAVDYQMTPKKNPLAHEKSITDTAVKYNQVQCDFYCFVIL